MILKKDGDFFCDAWYYHLCPEADGGEKSNERILFDELRKTWQFVDRGHEVDIDYCPFCGKELRDIDPAAVADDGRGSVPEERPVDLSLDSRELARCDVKCVDCERDVMVRYHPGEEELAAGECENCRLTIE
ncbi:MAG: hypothetical protein GTN70_06530, partial [Deltaproteobacteria bacterium]|nr:hypothetical protein [Deltaproteobacteria bacterium]NIS77342.1 hypothetical protein [Deltaproteobacteria bacterium]